MRKPSLISVAAAITLLAGAAGTARAAVHDKSSALGLRTARFVVLDATGAKLTLDSETHVGTWRETPDAIDGPGAGDYTLQSNGGDLSAKLTYRVAGTGATVRIDGSNPNVGPNAYSCGVTPSSAPYTCQIEQDKKSYQDTNFHVVVQPRDPGSQTLTDPTERAAVMRLACGETDLRFGGCDVDAVDDVSYSLSPPSPLGRMVVNCGVEGTGGGPWETASETVGSSWSLGFASEFKLGPKAGAKLVGKAYVKHTWASSDTTSTRYKLDVHPGTFGWMERSTVMESIRADYRITLGNQTYFLPDATVSTPATGERASGVVVARSQPIRDPAATCSNSDNKAMQLPIATSPTLGHTYRIGLDRYNARVLSAGANDASRLKLEQSSTSDRRQQWRFDELPGFPGSFLIRNVADPDRCLDQYVVPAHVITYPCKRGTEGDVANQLWTTELDPTTNSFRLISKINGRALAAAGTAAGSDVLVRDDPDATLARWTFAPVGQ